MPRPSRARTAVRTTGNPTAALKGVARCSSSRERNPPRAPGPRLPLGRREAARGPPRREGSPQPEPAADGTRGPRSPRALQPRRAAVPTAGRDSSEGSEGGRPKPSSPGGGGGQGAPSRPALCCPPAAPRRSCTAPRRLGGRRGRSQRSRPRSGGRRGLSGRGVTEGGAAAAEAPPREGGAGPAPSPSPRDAPLPGGLLELRPRPPEFSRPGGARRRAGFPATPPSPPSPSGAASPEAGRESSAGRLPQGPRSEQGGGLRGPFPPWGCAQAERRRASAPPLASSALARLQRPVRQGRQREPVLHAARPGPARAALPEPAPLPRRRRHPPALECCAGERAGTGRRRSGLRASRLPRLPNVGSSAGPRGAQRKRKPASGAHSSSAGGPPRAGGGRAASHLETRWAASPKRRGGSPACLGHSQPEGSGAVSLWRHVRWGCSCTAVPVLSALAKEMEGAAPVPPPGLAGPRLRRGRRFCLRGSDLGKVVSVQGWSRLSGGTPKACRTWERLVQFI